MIKFITDDGVEYKVMDRMASPMFTAGEDIKAGDAVIINDSGLLIRYTPQKPTRWNIGPPQVKP